jgi:ABC-type Zn uptake system ZnuABC Zn-binding protein ZnuA
MKKQTWIGFIFIFSLLVSACQAAPKASASMQVLATETFLADIAQNVAGDRFVVDSLVPMGLDPHAFEPTPKDVARVSESNILIVNGAGLETWLQPVLENAGGQRKMIVASAGLANRKPQPGEEAGTDPHFWLDPLNVIQYVKNIQNGLSQADPSGSDTYAKNADAYIAKLKELDGWIRSQVDTIPPQRRLLVTNHEEFGYFADRYGFKVVGAVIPSFSSEAAPSAQSLAQLIEKIRSTEAPAVFLEITANPQLAQQIAAEAHVNVVTGLVTHSLTDSKGSAPTYLDMIRLNVSKIVQALK